MMTCGGGAGGVRGCIGGSRMDSIGPGLVAGGSASGGPATEVVSPCSDFGGEGGCLKSSSTQCGGFIFERLAMYWSPLKLVKTSQSSAPSDWARCKIRARLVSGWTMIFLPSCASAIKHSLFSPVESCAFVGSNDNVSADMMLASDCGVPNPPILPWWSLAGDAIGPELPPLLP